MIYISFNYGEVPLYFRFFKKSKTFKFKHRFKLYLWYQLCGILSKPEFIHLYIMEEDDIYLKWFL